MAILNNRVKSPKISSKVVQFIVKYVIIILIVAVLLFSQAFKILNKNSVVSLESAGAAYSISSKISGAVSGLFGPIAQYINTNKSLALENEDLKNRVDEVRLQLIELNSLQHQNKEQKDLLNFVSSLNKSYISTRILSLTSSQEGSYAIIDCGAKSGVQKNDAVVSSQGLVGKVIELSQGYAKVLLINNSRFRTSVITASGQRGIYVGDFQKPYISYLSDVAKLKEGELIFAAGQESAFLPEVLIGKISHIENDKVYISPAADINTRFVSVLTAPLQP